MSDMVELEVAVEFADNPDPRCPCVLLLDTSGSMTGDPIAALNQGLQRFKEELVKDSLASRRVEVAVVTFDSDVKVVQDFVTVDQFEPPTLPARGTTHIGSAIHQALDLIQDRKATYKANGIEYYRPWVFMITDGEPQGEPDDVVEQAAERIRNEEANQQVAFFAVGIEGANMEKLRQIAGRISNSMSYGLLSYLNGSQPVSNKSLSQRSANRSRFRRQIQDC